MPKTRPPYPAEFGQRMLERVAVGRTPAQLSREFGGSAQTIANWIAAAGVKPGGAKPASAILTHAELAEWGLRVGRKRVAPLMRQGTIAGVSRRRGFVVTTRRDARQRRTPGLVWREFIACGPNRLCVADITDVPSWAGFIDLAVVLDVWSRRVVGWSIGAPLDADLVLAALDMAFGQRCRQIDVRPSMGSVGDAHDNALAESMGFALVDAGPLKNARNREPVAGLNIYLGHGAGLGKGIAPAWIRKA